MSLASLASSVRSAVTRAKVQLAALGPRTLLQATGLANETFSNVELLLPPGYFGLPQAGADILILQVNGVRDHKVALGGDNIADRQADLAPGDRGIARGTSRIIFRADHVLVQDPQKIVLQAPVLQWTPDGVTFYTLATADHTHGNVQTGEGKTGLPGASPQVTG